MWFLQKSMGEAHNDRMCARSRKWDREGMRAVGVNGRDLYDQ